MNTDSLHQRRSGHLVELSLGGVPHFCPREVIGLKVPSPLLSGHHEKIRKFERAVSLVRTAILRPELVGAGRTLATEVLELEALEDLELEALGVSREQLARLKAWGK